MKKFILFILFFGLIFGTLDQSYVHTFSIDGTSKIERTMDLQIFSSSLGADGINKLQKFCDHSPTYSCKVDLEKNALSISLDLKSGEYYSFTSSYGLNSEYLVTINSIPTDLFAQKMEKILTDSKIDANLSSFSIPSIDLTKNNKESADTLRSLGVKINYRLIMPAAVSSSDAPASKISNKEVSFDLIDSLYTSKKITTKASELNFGYIIILIAIIIVLSLTFFFRK